VENKNLTAEQMLELAKGILPEAKQMIQEEEIRKHYLTPLPNNNSGLKEYIQKRRVFRRTMFAVRRKLHYKQTDFTPEEKIIKEIIDARLTPNQGLTWETFTFQWDVSPNPAKPFEIIQMHQWFKEGGRVDDDIGSFYPSAFTKQAI